jgi:hypothetical protein
MQPTRRRRASLAQPDHYAVEHPFLQWYSSYWKLSGARYVERSTTPGAGFSGDIFMGEMAARRFSIGADDDLVPALGIVSEDVEAVMSLQWTSAAFLRRVQRRDWVALSCPDARMENGGAMAEAPIRLWLPTTLGLLDGWIGAQPQPTMLRLVEMEVRKGVPTPRGGPALGLLPLSLKGDWEPAVQAGDETGKA